MSEKTSQKGWDLGALEKEWGSNEGRCARLKEC